MERAGYGMSDTVVLMTDMGILVGIFLLGFVAKMFPKRQGHGDKGTEAGRQ